MENRFEVIYDYEELDEGTYCLSETFDTRKDALEFVNNHKDDWNMSNFAIIDGRIE